ncbi:MAG: type II secretion system protein, partial [Planctomycetota bacterium]
MESTNRKTAAFTLVELLVVIAIIGILVSLLLP